jgi:threonine dehydrogenase-like Zn-dependent dehydrogenase
MKIYSAQQFFWTVFLIGSGALPVSGESADAPSPTPTPRTRTLAEYARGISLKTSGVADASGRIVISTETLSVIADGGTITIGGTSATGKDRLPTPSTASPSERARWRTAHNKQKQVITGLERRRSQLEIEIDHIGNQKLTIKTMASLQRAEAKLRQLDGEISAERAELARIVRDARRHGAEPGWFR